MTKRFVQDTFSPCFCKGVKPQEYQNQVAMKPFWRDALVSIDACLASEIAWLWTHGVETHGCCCGHGDSSLAYIGVWPEDIETMRSFGYEQSEDKGAVHPEQHFKPFTISS